MISDSLTPEAGETRESAIQIDDKAKGLCTSAKLISTKRNT